MRKVLFLGKRSLSAFDKTDGLGGGKGRGVFVQINDRPAKWVPKRCHVLTQKAQNSISHGHTN